MFAEKRRLQGVEELLVTEEAQRSVGNPSRPSVRCDFYASKFKDETSPVLRGAVISDSIRRSWANESDRQNRGGRNSINGPSTNKCGALVFCPVSADHLADGVRRPPLPDTTNRGLPVFSA